MESRVRYKIADIEFEAHGDPDFIDRERTKFLEVVFPTAMEALYWTQDEKPAAATPGKTNIADCKACWCNTCAKLAHCPLDDGSAETDEENPFPCVGCVDGIRYSPKEGEPDCGEYEEFDGENYG
ncbi:MAG: hypothetical protein LBD02_00960 [Christensenellaceae bacterium]|jgi:hypothetical protein|nr:hypothetical protein [Christensenellaceae bacterium]